MDGGGGRAMEGEDGGTGDCDGGEGAHSTATGAECVPGRELSREMEGGREGWRGGAVERGRERVSVNRRERRPGPRRAGEFRQMSGRGRQRRRVAGAGVPCGVALKRAPWTGPRTEKEIWERRRALAQK